MATKRKTVWTILGVFVALLLVGIYLLYRLFSSNYAYVLDWERIHGFKIPEPQKVERLYENYSFNGEGTLYAECTFDPETTEQVKQLTLWKTVSTDEELNSLTKRIDTIKGFMTEGGKKANPFTDHPFELRKGSQYYLSSDEEGSSFIAILQTSGQVDVLIDTW